VEKRGLEGNAKGQMQRLNPKGQLMTVANPEQMKALN